MPNHPDQPALTRPPRRSITRRIVMPIIILVVAAALVYWGRQREQQYAMEVRDAVVKVLEEIAANPDRDPLVLPRVQQMGLSDSAAAHLNEAIAQGMDRVQVAVQRGDADPPYGDGAATHRAIVRVQGDVRIVLRLHHPGDPQWIEFRGFWLP